MAFQSEIHLKSTYESDKSQMTVAFDDSDALALVRVYLENPCYKQSLGVGCTDQCSHRAK